MMILLKFLIMGHNKPAMVNHLFKILFCTKELVLKIWCCSNSPKLHMHLQDPKTFGTYYTWLAYMIAFYVSPNVCLLAGLIMLGL